MPVTMNLFSVVLETCIFVHQRPVSGGKSAEMDWTRQYGKLMFICS